MSVIDGVANSSYAFGLSVLVLSGVDAAVHHDWNRPAASDTKDAVWAYRGIGIGAGVALGSLAVDSLGRGLPNAYVGALIIAGGAIAGGLAGAELMNRLRYQ